MTRHECHDHKRQCATKDQDRAVPPRHRNGGLVLFVDQMIAVIRPEGLVMDDGVCPEGVFEAAERLVHEKSMECPLEERGEDDAAAKSNC